MGTLQQCYVATIDFFSKVELDSDSKITPIHVAAYIGNAFLWNALIVRVRETQPCGQFGRKPLHYAAAGGNLK